MFKWSIVFLTSREKTLENFLDIILIGWSSFSTCSLNKDIYSLTLEREFLYSIAGSFGNKRLVSIDSNEPPKFLVIFNSEKFILLFFSIWFFIYKVFIQFGSVFILNSSKKNKDKYLFSDKKNSSSKIFINLFAHSIFFSFFFYK